MLVIALAGVVGFLSPRRWMHASLLGAGGTVAGSLLMLPAAVQALGRAEPLCWQAAWAMPGAVLVLRLDALAALFLLLILFVGSLAAVYGVAYLREIGERRSLGSLWGFYNLLIASMILTVLAGDALVFLVAWETMALASFFLVVFEYDRPGVRAAGWIYLIATHIGTAFLVAFFVILGAEAGSLEFARFEAVPVDAGPAGLLFVFALLGFGAKAGFLPLHVWLPEAHPAAPSHVSAVLSGVMIKTGIYGLVRALGFLGCPPAWWGWLLVGIGLGSGIFGVLLALAQRDLKRLLAYSSVENIGIIALGLGLGVLGQHQGSTALVALGFGGALLHVVNHGLFKSLLFLAAGAVVHATGTREIERLGGLHRRMPWTAALFCVGAVAICGLPPLNGFVSEFLVYLDALQEAMAARALVIPALATIAGLALIGGLAVACFTKAFGIVFLGEPRTELASPAVEAGWCMRVPMLLLAAGCVGIGLGAPVVVARLAPAVAAASGVPPSASAAGLAPAAGPLVWALVGVLLLLALVLAILAGRARLLARRPVGTAGTWDCGYAQPSARMQYTASSFAQPLTDLFDPCLQTRREVVPPEGLFPRTASIHTHAGDVLRERVFEPLFTHAQRWLSRALILQHGRLQVYVLYIALTLVALLFFAL